MKKPYEEEKKGKFNLYCIILGHQYVGIDDIYFDTVKETYYIDVPKGKLCEWCGKITGTK